MRIVTPKPFDPVEPAVRRGRVGAPVEDAAAGLSGRAGHVARILRRLNRRLGGPLDAHDLADLRQDSMLVAWMTLGRGGEGACSREAWWMRLCKTEIQSRVRRKRRRTALLLLRSDAALDGVVAPVPVEDPLAGRVRHALAMLVEPDRDVVRLKHFQGMTFEELAAHLREPISTVKSRYYRAVTRLESLLRPVWQQRRD